MTTSNKNNLNEKINLALGQDGSIVCRKQDVSKHPGHSEKYLDELGISRKDLKRLEKHGLAIRGYTKNVWLPGETLPNGKIAEGSFTQETVRSKAMVQDGPHRSKRSKELITINVPTLTFRGNGSKVRWILLGG